MKYEICRIDYQFSSAVSQDSDFRCLTEIDGDIIVYGEDDSEDERLAGKVKYFLLNGWKTTIIPEAMLDLLANTAHFMGHIYDRSGCQFRKKIQNLFQFGTINPGILILDRVELLPEFRGNGWFGDILEDGIEWFGHSVSLLALKAFPLQFEFTADPENPSGWQKEMSLATFNHDEKKARQRLEHYYAQSGFIKIDASGIMVKPLDNL